MGARVEGAQRPSARLWGAALAGLVGAVACGGGAKDPSASTDDSDSAPANDPVDDTPEEDTKEVLSNTKAPDLTLAAFTADCTTRGGVVQIHATCAGNNACAGMSFNKWSKDLTEHTCKGLNSCGGASCVVLPPDQGRDAAELYEERCGSMCHGSGFTLYVAPGVEHAAALAAFADRTPEAQLKIIAFGARGMTAAGTALANMPAFHGDLSRAEIERLVAHVRSLEVEATTYGIPGETEDFTDAM